MVYALWDTQVGNRIDWYDSEVQALADVRLGLARYGRDVVRAWALMRHDDTAVEAIASADELIERAQASETPA
jgi:hypothetical protein